jgi:hypothetical protein
MCKATEALNIVLTVTTLYEHRWQQVCLKLALWRHFEFHYFRESARDLDLIFSLSKISKGVGNWFSLVGVIALDPPSSTGKRVTQLQFSEREKTECSCGTFSLA